MHCLTKTKNKETLNNFSDAVLISGASFFVLVAGVFCLAANVPNI